MSVAGSGTGDRQGPDGEGQHVPAGAFKEAVGRFASGVVILSIRDAADEELGTRDDIGMTATAFMSVSVDPPLVQVGVDAESYVTEVLERQDRWAVMLLAHEQKHIAGRFALPGRPSSRVLLAGEAHHRGAYSDAMIVDGGVAALECRTHQLVEAGDHVLAIGRVLAIDSVTQTGSGRSPAALVHYAGRYHRVQA